MILQEASIKDRFTINGYMAREKLIKAVDFNELTSIMVLSQRSFIEAYDSKFEFADEEISSG